MKKLFLTSGLVLCMACPAFAEHQDINANYDQETGAFTSYTLSGGATPGCTYPDTLDSATEPTTFYAKWGAHTYDVRYNPGSAKTADYLAAHENTPHTVGGSAVIDTTRPIYNAAYTVKNNGTSGLTNYSQTGYHFTGWRSNYNMASGAASALTDNYTAGGTQYAANASIEHYLVNEAQTIDLYAQWEPDTHTLTYNSGAFSTPNSNATSDQTVTFDTSFTVKSFAQAGFTAAPGYTFKGWSDTAQDAVVANNWSGAWVAPALWNIDGDKTLYAAYTANPYTLTYDCGQFSSTKVATRLGVIAGDDNVIDITFADTTVSALTPSQVCALQGYHVTADEWSCVKVDENGNPILDGGEEQVVAYTAESGERVVGTWNVPSSVKCSVTWTPNTIGLGWDAGVGATAGTAGGQTCTYGEGIVVAGKPTLAGYDFQGWTTDPTNVPSGTVVFKTTPPVQTGTSITAPAQGD